MSNNFLFYFRLLLFLIGILCVIFYTQEEKQNFIFLSQDLKTLLLKFLLLFFTVVLIDFNFTNLFSYHLYHRNQGSPVKQNSFHLPFFRFHYIFLISWVIMLMYILIFFLEIFSFLIFMLPISFFLLLLVFAFFY